jgi:restriction system protein
LVEVALGGVGIALIGLALCLMLVREYPVQTLALVGFAAGARHYLTTRKSKRRASTLESAVRSADRQIERHRSALVGYYRQSVRRDQFGNEDAALWRKWIATFVETQILPQLRVTVDQNLLERLSNHVDQCVRKVATTDDNPDATKCDSDISTPLDYERNCASSLFRRGWTVHPTPATGDNGADVIAEKAGKRLVIQCKLYSQPVGNKAVQEAYSALKLYDGTHACVVAPNGFTAQAERAAHGLSVRLLHHSQLEEFADELTGRAD